MSLHLKLLDIDHPLTFEESKLRQIEAHPLIYLSTISGNECKFSWDKKEKNVTDKKKQVSLRNR